MAGVVVFNLAGNPCDALSDLLFRENNRFDVGVDVLKFHGTPPYTFLRAMIRPSTRSTLAPETSRADCPLQCSRSRTIC